MFDHNWDNFEHWAKIDKDYQSSKASTGIYQCYCIYKNNHNKTKIRPNGKPKKLRHHVEWTIFRGKEYWKTCDFYIWNFVGG